MPAKPALKKTVVFSYSGTTKDNRKVSGEIDAAGPQAARAQLQRRGIRVKRLRRQSAPLFSLGDKVKVKDIVFVTRQLSTMLEAGIPIAQSLRGIALGNEKIAVKRLVTQVREDVEAGTSLSVSLKKHPAHFNNLYVSLVGVGEESGTLDRLMDKVAAYLEKIEYIKGKIRSALFYPVLVIVVALTIVSILLISVIPEFENLFQGFGADLPALTQSVVNLSHLFQKYWFSIFIGAIVFVFVLRFLYKRSLAMQYAGDKLLLYLPVFGEVVRKAVIARVSRTLSTMFGAGVPLVDALETVSNAAGNRVFSRGILYVRQQVSSGQTLESAMAETRLFPGMVQQMVATGEESGQLETMLNKVADFYEAEVDATVAVISSLIEPFLIIILGLIVGTIVVAMYMPIFQMGSVF